MVSEECRNSFMTETLIIYIVLSVKIFIVLQLIGTTTTNCKLFLWLTLIKCHIYTSCQLRNYGARTIASEENVPKLNPNPDPNPNAYRGQFSSGSIVQTPKIT